MAKGRLWTPEEDAAIREAAAANADWQSEGGGIIRPGKGRRRDAYYARLKTLASELGRSYGAVRCRAHRIGARSYSRLKVGGE